MKIATLTLREREVLTHVVIGRLNKQVAYELGTVEKTIKFHRSAIIKKLGVRTIADRVRMSEKAGLKALQRTLRVRAFQSKTFSSAREFLDSLADGMPECLIVDLQMPGMTGLELHHHLTCRGIRIPTIIITAHSDNRVRERPESAGLAAIL